MAKARTQRQQPPKERIKKNNNNKNSQAPSLVRYIFTSLASAMAQRPCMPCCEIGLSMSETANTSPATSPQSRPLLLVLVRDAMRDGGKRMSRGSAPCC